VGCPDGAYIENLNFSGKAITLRSINPENPSTVEATVVDGSGVAPDDDEGSVVTFNHDEHDDSVIDGLTLTGGRGTHYADYYQGGGIICLGTNPTIRNCRIVGNEAHGGGGVYVTAWSGGAHVVRRVRLIGCSISDNHSFVAGGGLDVSWGGVHGYLAEVTMENCVLSGNTALYLGSAISGSGDVTMRDCLVTGNAASHGAAVYLAHTVTISGCTFRQNQTGDTAGVVLELGSSGHVSTVEISQCTIEDNATGGIGLTAVEGSIDDCTVRNNAGTGVSVAAGSSPSSVFPGFVWLRNSEISDNCGGAALWIQSDADVSNCLIVNNDTAYGFAVLANTQSCQPYGGPQRSITLRNCTIAANTSPTPGCGGIYAPLGSGLCRVYNCIVWDNFAPELTEDPEWSADEILVLAMSSGSGEPPTLAVEYSVVQGGITELGIAGSRDFNLVWMNNKNQDPEFVDDRFHIERYSAPWNAGDPDYVPEEGETDIDGDPRVLEGRVDMGADEVVP
jgi:hypothetical protein